MKTDVIIVGAGPTGLSLACQLTRYGVDFVIIDKNETTSQFSKAIGVQARTLEIYEQIGLAEDLIAEGAKAERAKLVEGGEVRGTVELSNIGQGLSPYPFLLVVEQGKHEKLLDNYLKAQGKDVHWQTELANFVQDKDGVTAQIKTADGATESVEAKFLVGCDGAKSYVRHALGLEFEGSTFERLFYVADVKIDWSFPHDSLYICLAQNTITAFFPMVGENRFRIIGTFPENEERREGEVLYEEIEKQIRADTKLNLDISEVNWFSVYRVHSRRVNNFASGRCFVAGDSAHIHTPAGGQGMNTGIQDGYNLAWKLALVLTGRANAKILDSYNEERSANAKHLLETTDRIFQFGVSSATFTAYFRTHIRPYIANFVLQIGAVKSWIFPLISQIGINYRNSSISRTEGYFSVKAGDRMPYLIIDGASIYDKLQNPKFHLIIFTDGQNPVIVDDLFKSRYSSLVDFFEFPLYPNVATAFGTKETFSILLRPDNYIGLITADNSGKDLTDYLQQIL